MIAQPKMTEEEFMRLPNDGHKWELVDGAAREVPTSFEHAVVVVTLTALLMPYAKGRGYLTGSQAGFRMSNGNIRCPDAAFTRKVRFPGGKPPNTFARFAADLCVEIISPSEEPAEMRRKISEYFDSGAQQVWHMFPEMQRVIVYTSPLDSRTYEADDEIEAGDLLPGFRSRVWELFVLE